MGAGKFELRLEENEKRGNKNGFFVGDTITIADLKFVPTFGLLDRIPGATDKVKKDYPRCFALMDKVSKNEKIKAFNDQFAKNVEDSKANKKTEYKYAGKFVCGAFEFVLQRIFSIFFVFIVYNIFFN